MVGVADHMTEYLERQGGKTAQLNPTICLAAGQLEWGHRDPFDRMLAATALHYDLALISADVVFDAIALRIW